LLDEDDQDIPLEQTGLEIGQQFIDRRQILLHPDPYIGAVQGPNYYQTGLFYNAKSYTDQRGRDAEGWSPEELEEGRRQRYEPKKIQIPRLPEVRSSSCSRHGANLALDLDFATLPSETIAQLKDERVDLKFEDENEFKLELGPKLGKRGKSRTNKMAGDESWPDIDFKTFSDEDGHKYDSDDDGDDDDDCLGKFSL
jgi:hypothetical protein